MIVSWKKPNEIQTYRFKLKLRANVLQAKTGVGKIKINIFFLLFLWKVDLFFKNFFLRLYQHMQKNTKIYKKN